MVIKLQTKPEAFSGNFTFVGKVPMLNKIIITVNVKGLHGET